MKSVQNWTPAMFCACISMLAMFMQIGSDSNAWKPTFYGFLPMCFVFMGFNTARMEGEIQELQKQLSELLQKKSVN